MSWDADLVDARPGESRLDDDGDPYQPVLRSWNYTHNTNPMLDAALDATGFERPVVVDGHYHYSMDRDGTLRSHVRTLAWFRVLDGLPGPEGAALLDRIIRELESNPVQYEDMNPENGWGDYVSLLGVLREMRAAVPEWPTTWHVCG